MNKREPLVDPLCTNSPYDRIRKNLPTVKFGSRDMDTTDPRKTTPYNVKPDVRFYLDIGDDQRSK